MPRPWASLGRLDRPAIPRAANCRWTRGPGPLGCSREALARALARLAGGAWRVERRLVAEPNR